MQKINLENVDVKCAFSPVALLLLSQSFTPEVPRVHETSQQSVVESICYGLSLAQLS